MTISLAAIEREVARRCGPFAYYQAASGTIRSVTINRLKSSLALGGQEDMYILRRGLVAAGTAVPGFTSDDRIRLVADYDPAQGRLVPDSDWTTAPVATEMIELHLLDPEQELRVAVQNGLQRCYYVDRAQLTLSSASPTRNLTGTATLGWLKTPDQVYDVLYATTGSTIPPLQVPHYTLFEQSGSLWIAMAWDPYPATVYLLARRPVGSYVCTGTPLVCTYSATGPTADAQEVNVDLEYAAAAGHAEAWRIAGPRLRPIAQTGLYPSQEAAAAEMTRMARAHFRPPARRAEMMTEWLGVTSLS